MTTDYHTKPLLQVRVPRESAEWARGEAARRGQGLGDFVDALITAERTKVGDHAVGPAPVGAEQPKTGEPQR